MTETVAYPGQKHSHAEAVCPQLPFGSTLAPVPDKNTMKNQQKPVVLCRAFCVDADIAVSSRCYSFSPK